MKRRVLFPHGETVGWVICARCKSNRKDEPIAHLTRTADGKTAVFVADTENAAVLRRTFGRHTKTVWREYEVADLAGPVQSQCRRHGAREVTVADVLGAIGDPDTPRIRLA